MSDSRFDRVKPNVDFVKDVNSDTKSLVTQTIKTRNQTGITIEPNRLNPKERSRVKHGRTLTMPLFVEELDLIEQTVAKLSQYNDISVTNFMRQTLLEKCLSVLGKDEYNRTNNLKRNVVKNKK